MQRVLDIDLDFFLSDCCYPAPLGCRPDDTEAAPWTAEAAVRFLEEQCGLRADQPLPGRIFETHDGALTFWQERMEDKSLSVPFWVTHVDAHSDLGIGKPGPNFVLYNVLARHPSARAAIREYYALQQLDEANYLLFALAFRWIGGLDNVRIPVSHNDVPHQILCNDGTGICLPQAFPQLFEARNGPEPVVPYRAYSDHRAFSAEAPYDFVTVAISPRYAPKAADALLPVLSRYIHFL